MGFFSGLVGGLLGGSSGGGGSSSTATTQNKVTVNPVTNIDIDVDTLAEAIESGNTQSAQIELLKLKTSVEIAQEEQKNNKELLSQFAKFNEFIPVLIVGGGLYLFTKKGKK